MNKKEIEKAINSEMVYDEWQNLIELGHANLSQLTKEMVFAILENLKKETDYKDLQEIKDYTIDLIFKYTK